MKRLALWLFLSTGVAAVSSAQQQGAVASTREIVVKTVPLHHLSSGQAVKLLTPYIQTPGAGVFDVSAQIRAVTIRETPKVFAEMMAVLNQYDRDPASVTLNFQLIAAENTNTRDPGVAGLDSLLRGVLKYSGYRLLTTAVVTASEDGTINQVLSANGSDLSLQVHVTDVRIEGNDASVHLAVTLMRNVIITGQAPVVLSTGVTVPMGQTVVLGSSATDTGQRALILTVRPQLTTAKK